MLGFVDGLRGRRKRVCWRGQLCAEDNRTLAVPVVDTIEDTLQAIVTDSVFGVLQGVTGSLLNAFETTGHKGEIDNC